MLSVLSAEGGCHLLADRVDLGGAQSSGILSIKNQRFRLPSTELDAISTSPFGTRRKSRSWPE